MELSDLDHSPQYFEKRIDEYIKSVSRFKLEIAKNLVELFETKYSQTPLLKKNFIVYVKKHFSIKPATFWKYISAATIWFALDEQNYNSNNNIVTLVQGVLLQRFKEKKSPKDTFRYQFKKGLFEIWNSLIKQHKDPANITREILQMTIEKYEASAIQPVGSSNKIPSALLTPLSISSTQNNLSLSDPVESNDSESESNSAASGPSSSVSHDNFPHPSNLNTSSSTPLPSSKKREHPKRRTANKKSTEKKKANKKSNKRPTKKQKVSSRPAEKEAEENEEEDFPVPSLHLSVDFLLVGSFGS